MKKTMLFSLARWWVPAIMVMATSTTASTVRAQSPDAPVTMGSLVMMRVEGAANATEAVGGALAHAEPGVRAVAARLAAVGRLQEVRSRLIAALASETVDAVAAEQVVALFVLGAPDAMDAASGHLSKAGPRARGTFALEAARFAPDRFITQLPFLFGQPGANGGVPLIPAVSLGVRLHPAARGAMLAVWLDHAAPSTWPEVSRQLAAATTADASEVPVLIATLSSSRVEHREPTVWLLLNRIGRGIEVPAAVQAAALPRQSDPGELTWETFGRELMARRSSGARVVDRSAFLAREAKGHLADVVAIAGLEVLTPAERSALEEVMGSPQRPRPPASQPVAPTPRVRVFDNIWGGFLGSLFAAVGCEPRGNAWPFGGARLTYSAEGLPARLAVDPSQVSAACVRATTALAQVTLSDRREPVSDGDVEWILLPMARAFVTCADAIDLERGAFERMGLRMTPGPGGVEMPRKTRDVRPLYPKTALARNTSGTVILDATVSKEGCIRTARLLRGVDLELDLEALRSVLQWQYAPALLQGEPVDVTMTVTVNFQLVR